MKEATQAPRALSLCSGYGGLVQTVENLTGAQLVAYAEKMPAAAKVMAHRWPDVPNLGDITEIKWRDVRDEFAPDIVEAGFPCQDISDAGKRVGISGDRSGIWKNVCQAVGILRPRLVFLENVAAIRGRGLDVVTGDLAQVGYDVRWTTVRASDSCDAPHPRSRWFAVARPHRPVRNANGVQQCGTGSAGQRA